ncbi:LOW QUALITY PROTEIN: hypothetical protein N665_0383s0031 [Sinapis alba]|nr:LOW QUALITY PROTEIN: hypothetical protein N665_0383s0031 [Sinapis alba]
MKISQDPITCVYQTSNQFWSRVADAYEAGKIQVGMNKSIHCRIQTIEKATKKLHACLKQCANRHRSCASNDDVNFEKFKDGDTSAIKMLNSCGFEDTNSAYDYATQESLEKGNKQLLEQLKKASAQKEQHLKIQSKNYAFKKTKRRKQIFICDVNFLQDHKVSAYIQSEQTRTLLERSEEQQAQQPPQTSTSFKKYFNDLSDSGNGLPDY